MDTRRRRLLYVATAGAAAVLALPAAVAATGVVAVVHSCGFLAPATSPTAAAAAILPAAARRTAGAAAGAAAVSPSPPQSTAAASWLVLQRGGGSSSGNGGSHQPHAAASSSTASPEPPPLLLPVPAFTSEAEAVESENGRMWSRLLVESFQRVVGRPLLPGLEGLDDRALAQALFAAPRVVVSHQTQPDPVLCYGNRMALALWEMDLSTLTSTPSRLTAEPMERAERQRLLDAVAAQGYIDDYKGVRISSTGKRFLIKQCIVWEVFDAAGVRRGQAATFDDTEPLG